MKANSKNLLYSLLEQMNYELNQINLKINQNFEEYINIYQSDQSNKNLELSMFIKEFTSENNNIISQLFFSLIENESICIGCNSHKYNYEIIFPLKMSLETIYNKIYGNNQNKIRKLNLLECFANFYEVNYLTGDNALFCNICNKQMNSNYIKKLYSLSPIIIIILNRGKDNQIQYDVDFPEEINLHQFILNPQINYEYNLVGIVSYCNNAYIKHIALNEWYCYDEYGHVTKLDDQKNGYRKGVPYILFYETKQGNNRNILFDYCGNNFSNNHNFNNNFNFNNNQNNSNININNMGNNINISHNLMNNMTGFI